MGLVGLSCQQLDQGGTHTSVREADGLHGPVRSTEVIHSVLVKKEGEWDIGQQKPVRQAAYDRHGRKTEQTVYADDGTPQGTIRFQYDESGHETEAVHFDIQDQLKARVVSSYDVAERLAESITYTATQELTARTVFTYDAVGNQIATQRFTADGNLTSRTTSVYDTQGNLIEKKWYRAIDTPVRTRTAKYDYLGALVSDSVYNYAADGTLTERTDVRYDPQGRPQAEVLYREDGQFKRERSFTYQSDAFGNWTLQTITTRLLKGESPSFEPPRVISRTLTYYGRGKEEAEQGSE
jgi:hypothetical protein